MKMGSDGSADPPRGDTTGSTGRLSRTPKGDTEKIGRLSDGDPSAEGITPTTKRRVGGIFICLDTEGDSIHSMIRPLVTLAGDSGDGV
mmetsp:Transcript_3592/g.6249  ORF Transcript_3592/g.6249 Transcript_3592/m.6249 type:complete len:88 (-) Transcript_3592:23-286(-)